MYATVQYYAEYAHQNLLEFASRVGVELELHFLIQSLIFPAKI